MVLLPNPQLSGSFVAPSMQVPVSDSAGSAQFVKSALIWESALLFGFVHSALLAMMIASLSACSALGCISTTINLIWNIANVLTQVSAQTGRAAVVDRPHGVREFCIIALHITLVVKRA